LQQHRGIPVLGICRGMQLINVAHGGTLVQALETLPSGSVHRRHIRVLGRHRVEITHDSWWQSFLTGDELVAIRGKAPDGPGFWFPPTVLGPVDPNSRVAVEEIFGPVAVLIPFDDEADAVGITNASRYALSGSVWTRDVGRALRMSRAVQAGALSINSNSAVRYWTPFGGMKESGLGRELGPNALDAFTEEKNVFFSAD
jgi:acyl-CoA reductase-like NAD-dependent aldehyde dehydrogenase